MISSDHAILYPVEIKQEAVRRDTAWGLIIALSIIALWAVSLVLLVSLNIAEAPVWLIIPAMLWQTFLFTGLFITAHDAMHGSLFPQNLKINNAIGSFAVFAYGLFSYKKLLRKHWSHHRHPASESDPDFHHGKYTNPFAWYLYFMKNYWSWRRFISLALVFNTIAYLSHVNELDLVYFWVIPSLLSSVQLFYFGTFLPHREPEGGYNNAHRAKTIAFPIFLSFITCYHFGYHEEHHEHPHVPWWQLPMVHQLHAN